MKTNNVHSIFKITLVAFLLLSFGFLQEAKAQQLTVINNTNCWVIVGEHEGNNCGICNNPAGTWIPPFPPFNVANFNSQCTVITPFLSPWIGIKYAVGPNFGVVGATSYSFNNTYYLGMCGISQNNSQCFNPVLPVWGFNPGTGTTTVSIQ